MCVGVCAQTKKTKQKPRKHANPQKTVWFLLPRGGLRVIISKLLTIISKLLTIISKLLTIISKY